MAVIVLMAAFFVLCPSPVFACTPLLSAALPAVFLAYVVWLVATLALALRFPFVRHELQTWAIVVPIGFLFFALPVSGLFTLVPALMLIAFPMHMAVQLMLTLRGDGTQRVVRALYYGVPLLLVLVLGIAAKVALYAQNGGMRALIWNYRESAGPWFFALWLIVGLTVLFHTLSVQRSAAPGQVRELDR